MFPYIPGFYASGVVEEVGQGVTEFKPGDRIFGSVKGAYAEYGIAKAQELVKMPGNLTFEDAATIKAELKRPGNRCSPKANSSLAKPC